LDGLAKVNRLFETIVILRAETPRRRDKENMDKNQEVERRSRDWRRGCSKTTH
jgi:hypothetical protein